MRMAIPYSRTLLGPLQWYSVLIVTGILVAIWLAGREERRLGLPRDTVIDLALIVIPCGIIGARFWPCRHDGSSATTRFDSLYLGRRHRHLRRSDRRKRAKGWDIALQKEAALLKSLSGRAGLARLSAGGATISTWRPTVLKSLIWHSLAC